MDLKTATYNVYKVFSSYTILGNLRDRSCDCCVTDNEIKMLLSKPLKELNNDDLQHFLTSAVTTFGDIQDYKHFLPRILELMQRDDYDIIDDFLTFEKLNYVEWETWNNEEINAIDNYFLALWESTILNETSKTWKIESTLELVKKYIGLEKAMQIWSKNITENSILYIVDLVLNGFNYREREYVDILQKHFSTKPFLDKLEEVFFKTEDKIEANRISIAYGLLEDYKKI